VKPATKPVIPIEDAEREGYGPVATPIQNDDFLIRACDGDQEYVWVAQKRRTTYRVVEVYPGLSVRHTAMREAQEDKDLVVSQKLTSIDAVITDLTKLYKALFDGEVEPETAPEPASATAH
jgi:hypothetical protein